MERISDTTHHLAERAQETASAVASGAQERVGGAVDVVRGKAGDLQATLADSLDEGARAIRQRTGANRGRARGKAMRASAALADRMERSASWLRENELTDLGTMLERQLREHPGRTAVVALGIGYLLGRASRRSDY